MIDVNSSPTDIQSFVAKVVRWSQLLQSATDAGVERAHQQLEAGIISFAAFNVVLQQKIEVTQKCFDMMNAASAVLLAIAESELAPIEAATAELAGASKTLRQISNAVAVVSDLAVAAAALAGAIAAPSLATVGAAASAIHDAADKILEGTT